MKILLIISGLILLSFYTTNAAPQDWRAYKEQAESFYRQDEFENALDFAEQALDMAEKQFGSRHPYYAEALNILAIIKEMQGHYVEAEKFFLTALDIIKTNSGEKSQEYADVCFNLATVYFKMKSNDKAESAYLQCIIVYEKSPKDLYSYLQALTNLGDIYAATGKIDKAIIQYEKARDIYQTINYKDETEVFENYKALISSLESIYRSTGAYKEALPLCLEIIAYNLNMPDGKGDNYYINTNKLADIHTHTGKYREADSLLQLSFSHFLKKYGSDNEYYIQTLVLRAELFELSLNIDSASILWNEAIDKYLTKIERSFASYNDEEKSLYFSAVREALESYYSFVIKNHRRKPELIMKMFEVQIATKALLLNSSKKVRKGIIESGNSELIEKYDKWVEMKNLLSHYYTLPVDEIKKRNINIGLWEKNAGALEKELSYLSASFKNEYSKKIYTWPELKKCLKKNEAAVEIVRFGGRNAEAVYAAVILTGFDNSAPQLLVLENGSGMENEYLYHHKTSINKKIRDENSYDYFWKSIAEKLSGAEKIYFSPDGAYNLINIQSIYNPASGKYLIDEYDIINITNAKDIIESAAENEPAPDNYKGKSAVLFGAPDYNLKNSTIEKSSEMRIADISYEDNDREVSSDDSSDSQLSDLARRLGYTRIPPLPGTKIEVNSIAALLAENGFIVTSHLEANATKAALLETNNPYILHIATHGKFVDNLNRKVRYFGINTEHLAENPLLRSMLFFAGAENALNKSVDGPIQANNAILTAFEAMNLNIDKTELVVLSACETGLGEIKSGEGVYGLQRAFRVAGAKTIIMSLWSVNDLVTQELMTTFYEKWLSGKSKRLAFTEARQIIKDKYKHPYFWAAFVMIGE